MHNEGDHMDRNKKRIRKSNLASVMGEKRSRKGRYYITSEEVDEWFDTINKEVFDSKLPEFDIIKIGTCKKRWGYVESFCWSKDTPNHRKGCRGSDLKLNSWFRNKQGFLSALAHEMVHHYNWICDKEPFDYPVIHGKTFYAWKDKLKEFGVTL